MNYEDCTTMEEIDIIRKAEKNAAHKVMRDTLGKSLGAFRAARKRVTKALDTPTHRMVSDWQRGETIYFSRNMSTSQMSLNRNMTMHNSIDADSATFYLYQPRKQLLWLQFDEIKNSTYADNVMPFTLNEVRNWGMKRTDV